MSPFHAAIHRASCALALVALTSLVACSGAVALSPAATQSACDPLAPKPITLGAIVGIGKDAQGTLYVDAANGVFVSNDGTLVRQHVLGSGSSGTSEFLFTFTAPDADVGSAQNLLVETAGATASAMALGPSNSRAFLDQAPAGTTALTLVDASAVSGLPVVNTPNQFRYIADVANGAVLATTAPMNGDTTSDDGGLAIFYGPASGLVERQITSFGESLSGDGSLTFLVGDTPYELAFGQQITSDSGPFGDFTLLGLTPRGGAELAVTLRAPTPEAAPAELSFTCLP